MSKHRVYRHPTSGLPQMEAAGQLRTLGALPPRLTCNLPRFGDAHPVLPRSQWIETSQRHYPCPVVDQGQSSSCVWQATWAAFTRIWQRSGQPLPAGGFSHWGGYAQINRGQDAGSVVSDALEELKSIGCPLASDVPEGALFLRQIPALAWAHAAWFRIDEAWQCRSFDEIGSALSQGFIVVSGILVGRAFMTGHLDADGAAPLLDVPVGGHATCQIGLKRSRSGLWLPETQNSWSTSWGDGGYCYLREQHFTAGGQPLDAFALIGPRDNPQEAESDPPVVV